MRRLCLRIPLLARLLWPDSVVGAAVHAAPVEVTRRMLPSGSGSLEVVRVTTVLRDGSRRDHVEKVLAPTSAEHDFWTTGLGKDLVREGERFTVVAPTRIRDSTAGRTLEFPFVFADASPVGAELHTVLRHMRVAGADEATIDGMFREYLAVIRDFVPEADEVRVRAAAEVRYFARFTDTGLASGRSRFSFESAMAGIARAADLVGEPRAGEE